MTDSEITGKIIIVGDLFPVPSNYLSFSEGCIEHLFGNKICTLFDEANVSICNLEGALTDCPEICEKTGPVVKAPTSTINGVKKLGIDFCTLANNHVTDAGHQGVIDTMHTLDLAGIKYLGAGESEDTICKSAQFSVAGKVFGIYNVCETMYNQPGKNHAGAHLYDEYQVCKDISGLKQDCDYVIVVYHGGAEKFRFPSPETRKRFHRMVDSGANMILSQHTHCIGSEEYYKDAYLLYGQGNFLFRSFNNEFTDTGIIVEIEITNNQYIVHKHLVNAIDDVVRYAEIQDFSEFDQRSLRVKDEEYVLKLYKQYCYEELCTYLYAYRGSLFDRFLRHFSLKLSKKFLLAKAKKCNRTQLLLTLHSLRSEQNRETAIYGLVELLNKQKYQ